MPNKYFNTILVSIFLILEIINKTSEEAQSSYVLYAIYAIMFYLIINSFLKPIPSIKTNNSDVLFFILFVLYCIIHLMVGETPIQHILLFIFTVFFLLRLKHVQINCNIPAYAIILLFLILVFSEFNHLITSAINTNFSNSFQSIFENPNTFGVFITFTITATLVFVKNKKFQLLLIPLLILAAMSCKSRNVILFCTAVIFFGYLLNTRYAKFVPILFFLFLGSALYYLTIIEPQSLNNQAVMFGKEAGSAGRSLQIILTIARFPLTLFGIGERIPNDYSISMTSYAIHCLYINSIYAMGIAYMALYIWYLQKLFHELKSPIAKALLLSSHIHFMFEPGLAFYIGAQTFLPLFFATLKINEEKQLYKYKTVV